VWYSTPVRLSLGVISLLLVLSAALLGAGPAAADNFCRVSTNPCQGEDLYESETTFSGALKTGSAEFKGLGTTLCTASTIGGSFQENPGSEDGLEPVAGQMTSLTFSGCKNTLLGSCSSASAQNLPYTTSAVAESGGNGSVTASSSGKGIPTVKFVCGAAECTFQATSPKLKFTGGTPATLAAESVAFTGSKGMCGEKATFSASYSITKATEPEATPVEKPPLFLELEGLDGTLCKTIPAVVGAALVCNPATERYAGVVSGFGEGNSTFTSSEGAAGVITCISTAMQGTYRKDGKGFLEFIHYSGLKGGSNCSSTLEGNPEVTVKFPITNVSGKYASAFRWAKRTNAPQGQFFPGVGFDANKIRWEIEVQELLGPIKCMYRGDPGVDTYAVTNGTGAEDSTIAMNRNLLRINEEPAGAERCPKKMTLASTLHLEIGVGETIYVSTR
jgi:hypothetical protein